MDGFSAFDLRKALAFMERLKQPYFGSCDTTVGTLYQWRKIFCTHTAEAGGLLCCRECYKELGTGYGFPIGEGKLDEALEFLEKDALALGNPLRFGIVPVEQTELLIKRYGSRAKVTERPDWADYIYPLEQFLEYRGNKLHTQRNHVNRFFRDNPNARCSEVDDRLAVDCAELCCELLASDELSQVERNEIVGAMELLENREKLRQSAYCLEDGGRVLAFAVGEQVGDTLFEPVEKARPDIPGAFPAMAQAFAKAAGQGALWLNREDDAGDAGIRESKQRYRPDHLLKKYCVIVEE